MLHSWDISPEEAERVQCRLAKLVSRHRATVKDLELVAGVSVSRPDENRMAQAAAVVVDTAKSETVEVQLASDTVEFPYIPGLLAFRIAPLILDALEQLAAQPDLILVPGHGVAHPRRCSLASHIGHWTDIPTIGCAESLLVGEHTVPGTGKGSWAEFKHNGETVGAALRTRTCIKPVYVSVGHMLDLESAIERVLKACSKYRMPDPIRLARQFSLRHRNTGCQR